MQCVSAGLPLTRLEQQMLTVPDPHAIAHPVRFLVYDANTMRDAQQVHPLLASSTTC